MQFICCTLPRAFAWCTGICTPLSCSEMNESSSYHPLLGYSGHTCAEAPHADIAQQLVELKLNYTHDGQGTTHYMPAADGASHGCMSGFVGLKHAGTGGCRCCRIGLCRQASH
jgi:hypothetical protein